MYLGIFDEGAGLIGYNVFAYCANNPVIYNDKTGESLTAILIGIAIGALFGALAGWGYTKCFNIPKDSRWKYILGGALIGAVIGGCIGYALGAGSGAVLWSGPNMSEAAAAFAKQNGLKVLEKTLRGRLLTVLDKVLPQSIMRSLWEAASARFLLSYAGKQTFVHIFITAQAYGNMQSIFNSVEMQIIAELGLKIIWHYVK